MIHHGDCLDVMRTMEPDSVDAIVSDPPYGLSFMGKAWDHGVPGEPFWAEALRVAKPGAHLVAFGGTRTYHRLACAIEDAGWEVRDCLSWNFGSGFPKSHNIDKTGVGCACDDTLPGVRARVLSTAIPPEEVQAPVVLSPMQRNGSGAGVGEARPQGAGRLDGYQPCQLSSEDDGNTEPGVEGRRDDEAPEGELLGRPVRSSARVGATDGAEGRLPRGTPLGDGGDVREAAGSTGGGASQEPPTLGQPTREPGTLAEQPHPQSSGAWPTCGRCGKPSIPRGLGTALKPAWEPIILARKPLIGTVAQNVTQHGTGGLNIDGCRIGGRWENPSAGQGAGRNDANVNGPAYGKGLGGVVAAAHPDGRWPANVVLDEEAGQMLDAQSGDRRAGGNLNGSEPSRPAKNTYGEYADRREWQSYADTGGASRFFYTSKAPTKERWGILTCDCKTVKLPVWDNEDHDRLDPMGATLPPRGTCAGNSGDGCACSTVGCGSRPTALSHPGTKSTTATATSKTTDPPTFSSSPPPNTSVSTADVSGATGCGGSPVGVVATPSPSTPNTGIAHPKGGPCTGVVGPVTSLRSLPTSVCGVCGSALRVESHPTQKPIALMRWLCRLVTPPKGLILDPFCGSGTTGCAAVLEGFRFAGIEKEAEYVAIAEKRIAHWQEEAKDDQPSLFAPESQSTEEPSV